MNEITTADAIRVLQNERECVRRQSGQGCDHHCAACDLVLEDRVVMDAYETAIASIRAQQEAEKNELLTMSGWISVKDRLPENEKSVLAYAETRTDGKVISGHVVKAFYADGKYHNCVPKGWWESVRYNDESPAVNDFVTHWMPLPEPPKMLETTRGVTHE